MTEVIFLASVQGHQTDRVKTVADKLRKRVPDVVIKVVEGPEAKALLAKYKLQFGPSVVIDDRVEYVGVPRLTMLVDRLLQVKGGRSNPRTAGERPTAGPAKPPAAPAASRTATAPKENDTK